MVFVIGFALLLAVIAAQAARRDDAPWVAWALMTVLFGLIGALIGAIVSLGFGAFVLDQERRDRPEVELVALRGGVGLEGRVYVRGGYVSSAPHFLYYVKTPEGYRPGQVRADERVLIREERRDDARLQVSCLEPASASYSLWGIEPEDKECRYTFIVPEGTVQRGFALP